MIAKLSILVGSLLAALLMVLALYAWQQAGHWAFDLPRPDLAEWSIRSAALALAALAQAVILLLVTANVFRAGKLDWTLRLLFATVFVISLGGALALGWAGMRS